MLRDVYDVPNPYEYNKPYVLLVHGGTEVGKSRFIRAFLKDVCKLEAKDVWLATNSSGYKWFDKYRRQRGVIIDDFNGGMKETALRNVLDGYEYPFEEKGGGVVWCPWVIVITSDLSAGEWKFGQDTPHPEVLTGNRLRQITRRITHTIHMQENV